MKEVVSIDAPNLTTFAPRCWSIDSEYSFALENRVSSNLRTHASPVSSGSQKWIGSC